MIGRYKSLKILTLLIQSSVEVAVVWRLFCEHMFEVAITQALVRITATQTARLTIKNWLEAIQIDEMYFEWSTFFTAAV